MNKIGSFKIRSEDPKMYEEYLLLLQKRKELMLNKGFNNYPNRRLEHICGLNVYQDVGNFRFTKIMCGIGPSTNTEEKLLQMMRCGMNIARLNITSLGFEQTTNYIRMIRKAEETFFHETNQRISIAIDIAAPKAKIGKILLTSEGTEIIEGQSVWLTTNEELVTGSSNIIVLDLTEFATMIRYFSPRSRLFINDGVSTVIVRENYGDYVRCLVEQGGKLEIGSTVNFVWNQSFLHDCANLHKKTITFVESANVDMVMISFIRDLGSLLSTKKQFVKKIPLILKIENYISPCVLDEIINDTDGVLISRGLLGIDLPVEKVFLLQNQIISKCLLTVKPVFVGFQMLDSMITKPRPTRAEAADVANAVLSSVDGVVLGKETSKGLYTDTTIKTVVQICLEAEATISNFGLFQSIENHLNVMKSGGTVDYTEAACVSAVQASYNSKAKALVILTESGLSAFNVSALRPDCLILVVSRNIHLVKECTLYRSVVPLLYNETVEQDYFKEIDRQLIFALQWAKRKDILNTGDHFVCLTGKKFGSGMTKTVRIFALPENLQNFEISQPIKNIRKKHSSE